jgi:hypothetical protein
MRSRIGIAFLMVATFAVGCSQASEPPATSTGDLDETFQVTIVRFDPAGGPPSVTYSTITRREELREINERLNGTPAETTDGVGTISQGIARDSSCGGASIYIYDQTGGFGNRACFYGAGQAYLPDYARGLSGNWGSNVRSYWPGTEYGCFGAACSYPFGYEAFSAYPQGLTNAGYWAQTADRLNLTN